MTYSQIKSAINFWLNFSVKQSYPLVVVLRLQIPFPIIASLDLSHYHLTIDLRIRSVSRLRGWGELKTFNRGEIPFQHFISIFSNYLPILINQFSRRKGLRMSPPMRTSVIEERYHFAFEIFQHSFGVAKILLSLILFHFQILIRIRDNLVQMLLKRNLVPLGELDVELVAALIFKTFRSLSRGDLIPHVLESVREIKHCFRQGLF